MRIIARGNTLLLRPWSMQLSAACSYSRREKATGPSAQTRRFNYKTETLYEFVKEHSQTSAIVPSGLLPRILRACKRYKLAYELEDLREPVPEALLSQVEPLREFQPEVLAAIIHSHCGIIHCPTAFGKSFLICQICRMYPQLKILITTKSAQVRGSLFEAVCERCPHPAAQLSGSHKVRLGVNVLVATSKSLHKVPSDWPDLVLFDEVHWAGGAGVAAEITRFGKARRFGFSASPEGRSDNSDRLVEALFGPVICHVTYQEAEAAGLVSPIEARFINVSSPKKFNQKSDVALERNGYWRHKYRHQAIAKAAKSFGPEKQTLILVKTAEHVLYLHKYLPDYQVIHAGISDDRWQQFLDNGLVTIEDDHLKKVDVNHHRKCFEAGTLKKAICTPTWSEGVDFTQLEVLIRADGQVGTIPTTQIPGRLSRKSAGKCVGILIDFMDHFGSFFLERSLRRKAQYHDKGWTIVENWDPSW
jgi:superfamily II DNA or RNA helicase